MSKSDRYVMFLNCMKKTKIIVTLGPATDEPEKIKKLIDAGANVFRLNFSHGTKTEHTRRIKTLRAIEKEIKKPIAILQDLQGPKIRVGLIPGGSMDLQKDEEVILTTVKPLEKEIPVEYKNIVREVKLGDRILLDDGLLELKLISKSKNKIKCKVITGGTLYSNKGINLPDTEVMVSTLTEKDKKDLMVGLRYGVDFIALSFVKSGGDIDNLRRLIERSGKKIKIIAKIERHEAIVNIDDIIQKADGIIVARGDLGIETSLEGVPFIQKDIIEKCVAVGKPVIVATQMLDSMIRNPRSTRAETSDVANAILDGADAVMLSGETTVGKYPVNAVKAMRKIALTAERWVINRDIFIGRDIPKTIETIAEAIGKSACALVKDLGIKVIINATASGETARAVAKYRPHAPIISITHTLKTARELELTWGVTSCVIDCKTIKDMTEKAIRIVKDLKLVKQGDKIIIISGQKVGIVGGTNMIKVEKVN